MADDEIVQTIKIEVEGEDAAQSALDKIGESASTSFEQLQKAADTAGVSIEQFGQLSQKTQEQYLELSQRVQQSSQQMVQSTQELQQAAGAAGGGTRDLGGGLDDVSEKSGISSREMRGLGKIMRELGAGEAAGLALSFQKIGSSLGTLGVAAFAFAVAANTIVKFAKDTADAVKGVEDLAKATGTSAESLRLQERAFQSAGIAAKEYQKGMQGLLVAVLEGAPKIQDEIDKSAEAAIRAKAAFEKLKVDQGIQTQQFRLQTQQLGFQTQQLALQGQQLALNLASVRQQLSTLSATQDIERRRANLTVADAQANLEMLELQDRYLRGKISEASYEKQKAALDQEARDRAIQKARIDLENARQERDALPEKQRAQRSALELQQQQIELAQEQLPIQKEQLELQRQQLDLAKQQFDLLKGPDLADARRKANEAEANSLGPLIAQLERMKNGSKELINPLVTLQSRTQALVAVLAQAGISAADMAKGFNASNVELNKFMPIIAQMFDTMTGLQKLQFGQVLKGLQLPEDQIAQLAKGTAELDKFMAKVKELEPMQKQIDDASTALVKFGGAVKEIGTVALGTVIAEFRNLATAIKDGSIALFNMVMTPAASATNAFQWLTSSFDAALAAMRKSFAQFQRDIENSGGQLLQPSASGAHAAGGLLGGSGTGTSDSNLAWVSRGEYITPAGAVAQPGVLGFLEALRRSGGNLRAVLDGMGHFARGGLVMSTLPAFAGGGLHNVTINFPGLPEIIGLRAPSGVVDELRNAAAMAQVRSGGRKPSRYG